MNEAFSVLLDTAKLATGGSDITRREVRRLAAEQERRASEQAFDLAPFALNPVAIVATGSAMEPVDRLIGLQAAFGKFVGWLAGAAQFRLRLPAAGVLRFRFW